ncbi:ephrin-A5b [Lates japonicus]|uniref:Ephrin-A5b n=1 Tax=Lates japonicus TaxID=270547 RepID=A0AAD3MMY4_LATJO|nr:ephrin-A5b [Lates japonicus]
MPQVEMILFLILIIGMCVYGQDPASKVVSDRYAVYWNRTNPNSQVWDLGCHAPLSPSPSVLPVSPSLAHAGADNKRGNQASRGVKQHRGDRCQGQNRGSTARAPGDGPRHGTPPGALSRQNGSWGAK